MSVVFPGASVRPVDNHGGPMAGHYGLAVHSQEGDGSPFGWFSNPAAQASSHLWIAKSGALEQYVPLDFESWAQAAGNPYFVSVEMEGYTTEPLTDQQLARLATVAEWCSAIFDFPLELVDHDGRGVTTHAHYPSGQPDPAWGGHPCPGPVRSAQLPTVIELAVALTNPPAPPAPHLQEDEMFLASGDGAEWVITGTGRFQVAKPADGPGLLKQFGQTDMVPLSPETLANIPILPKAYAA